MDKKSKESSSVRSWKMAEMGRETTSYAADGIYVDAKNTQFYKMSLDAKQSTSSTKIFLI